MQRTKGAAAERKVVNMLKDAGFDSAERRLDQTRSGGHDIDGVCNLAIEVKDHKRMDFTSWWSQAFENAGSDMVPVVIYHVPNTSQWRAIVPLSWLNDELPKTRVAHIGWDDFVYVARERVPMPEIENENQAKLF